MKNKTNFMIVNFFTTIRMMGIFLLIPIYLSYGALALGITNIICFLTDLVDGKLAKKLKASTFFGSLYDGLTDKAFIAMNLAILCVISPLAIIPIFIELGIIGVQYTKYKSNMNIQSNIFGKAKMWVVGVSIVLGNILVDIEKLEFLGTNIINKISIINDTSLMNLTLMPVIVAELITLISYILEMFKSKDDIVINEEIKDDIEEKEEVISEEKELTLKEIMFSHDFYIEHKDENGLKLIRERAKK